MEKFLFISGMEKCGTTSLAHWLIREKIAENLVEGRKEPYLFARTDFRSIFINNHTKKNLWRLDASVGYALNPSAIFNMPEHSSHIVLCFRNPWERMWSAYKMYKLLLEKSKSLEKIPNNIEKSIKLHFPLKSTKIIERYLAEEAEKIIKGNFIERIKYEMNFFYTRGKFPFYSIILNNRYFSAIKNIAEKYPPKFITPVMIESFENPEIRRIFHEEILDYKKETQPLPRRLVLKDVKFSEEKPNFADSSFDFFRSFLFYEINNFEKLLISQNITQTFMDFKDLRKNIY